MRAQSTKESSLDQDLDVDEIGGNLTWTQLLGSDSGQLRFPKLQTRCTGRPVMKRSKTIGIGLQRTEDKFKILTDSYHNLARPANWSVVTHYYIYFAKEERLVAHAVQSPQSQFPFT